MTDQTQETSAPEDTNSPLTIEQVVAIINEQDIDIDDVDVDSHEEQIIDPLLRRLPDEERKKLQNKKGGDRSAIEDKILARLSKLKEIERAEELAREEDEAFNSPEAVARRREEKEEELRRKEEEEKTRSRAEYIQYLEDERTRLLERVENDADSPNIKYENDQKLNEIERALSKYKTPGKYYAGEAFKKAALGTAFTVTTSGLIIAGNMALNLMAGGAFIGLELGSILLGSAITSAIFLTPFIKSKTMLPDEKGDGNLTRRISLIGETENIFKSWSGVYGSLKKLRGGNKNNDMVSHEIAEGEGRGSGFAYSGILGGSIISSLTIQHYSGGLSQDNFSSQLGNVYNQLPEGFRETAGDALEPVANVFNKAAEYASAVDQFTFPGFTLLATIATAVIAKSMITRTIVARRRKAQIREAELNT